MIFEFFSKGTGVLFLALASQSLSIMFELIPYVRETFRRHLSPKQAVMLVEFDKLKRVRLLASIVSRYDARRFI